MIDVKLYDAYNMGLTISHTTLQCALFFRQKCCICITFTSIMQFYAIFIFLLSLKICWAETGSFKHVTFKFNLIFKPSKT